MGDSIPAGTTVAAKYVVERKLGEGGMGEVYLARNSGTGASVALKSPKLGMLQDDPRLKERFIREVHAMGRLNHPHIVKVYDLEEWDDRPVAVYQYLEGGSLQTRSNLALDRWLPQIADALDYLHREGLVHRDVKPANIFIDAHHTPYLGDFGIAKPLYVTGGSQHALTRTGLMLGAPKYVSPEAVEGLPVDGRADQYALAITVYERLAARMPFDADTPAHLFAAHLTVPPHPLCRIDQRYSEATSGVLTRALSKRPDDRFASCVEFAQSLLDSLQPLEEPAPPPAPAPPAVEPSPDDSVEDDENVDTRGWIRHWYLAPIVLCLLAILMIAIDFTLARHPGSSLPLAVLSFLLASELALFVIPYERRWGRRDKKRHIAIAVCGLFPYVYFVAGCLVVMLFSDGAAPFGAILLLLITFAFVFVSIALKWTAENWLRYTLRLLEISGVLLFMTGVVMLATVEPDCFIDGLGVMFCGGVVVVMLGLQEFSVWRLRIVRSNQRETRRL